MGVVFVDVGISLGGFIAGLKDRAGNPAGERGG
jgi:hypothetical protein